MALENGTGLSAADVAAVMGNGNNNGFGNDGFGGWWVILFILLAMGGNWGGNWGSGGGGAVPYIGQQADIQRGFDQQATMGQIAALQAQVGNGFSDAAVANCQGNASITAAITGGQYATAQAITAAKDTLNGTLNANQIADVQAHNNLAMALLQSGCDNKAGIADLKYTIATEACADRAAVTNGLQELTAQNNMNTNAITAAINSGIQSIKDDLCADRIAAKDAQIQALQNQLNMASLAASQTAQTAQLLTYGNQQAQNIINSCCPKPVPAYVVPSPNSCGCGNGFGACG